MNLIEFINYVQTAGGLAAPIFAILFWLERGERQDAQLELKEISKNSIIAVTEIKALIKELTLLFESPVKKRRS